MKHLFVYGILRDRLGLWTGGVLLDPRAVVDGFTLFSVNDMYPAAVRAENRFVTGQLWAVPDEAVPILDRVEGAPVVYNREVVEVKDHGSAEMYVWQQNTAMLKEVGSTWM
jgi:gamma-glutamylcyclotransferase (GGCT)/AIG2-like uncharacterized protein YtfP